MKDPKQHLQAVQPTAFLAERNPAPLEHQGGWSADSPDSDDEQGLLDYWRILNRRRGMLALSAVLGAVAGLLFSLPQTPLFRAQTTLEIQGLNLEFLGLANGNPTELSGGYSEADIQTQIKLLTSRSLVAEAASKVDLGTYDGAEASRATAWRRLLRLPEGDPEHRLAESLETAKRSLRVTPFPNSRIVEISADSANPELAADFLNALSDAFIRQNVEARWTATQYIEDWLDRQLDGLKVKLEKSEEQLQAYARSTGLIFTSEDDDLVQSQLRTIQEQLSEARAERIAKQSEFEVAKRYPDATLDIPHRRLLAAQREELAALSSTYTDAFPRVKSIRARITELEKSIAAEQRQILDRLEQELEAAQMRETLLHADYTTQAGLVSQQARSAIQYSILKREVETNRQLYDNLLQKGKEARLSSALQTSPIRVVDEAQTPILPFRPNHALNMLAGVGMVGLLSVAFVLFDERADRTIKRPGDTEWRYGVHELGAIPLAKSKNFIRVKLRSGKQLPSESRGRQIPTDKQPKMLPSGLLTPSGLRSMVAEAFYATITSMRFGSLNGAIPRSVVITSPARGDGKSTVVANLAVCLATTNRRVLVIDGDLRLPRQHELFGLPNPYGLAYLLGQRSPFNEVVAQTVVQTSGAAGVDVLTSGNAARQGRGISNLLHSPHLRDVLVWARQNYDCVLVDTPPVGGLFDARVLGGLTDATILVVRSGVTRRAAALATLGRLRKDGVDVLGILLNGWEPKNDEDTYGDYSAYYAEPETAEEPVVAAS